MQVKMTMTTLALIIINKKESPTRKKNIRVTNCKKTVKNNRSVDIF